MKKIFLLFVTASVCGTAFAHRHYSKKSARPSFINTSKGHSSSTARTTSAGDTLRLSNITADTLTVYGYGKDSGYVTGNNIYNDKAFAEKYTFNGNDSSLKVIGVMSLFKGKVSAASTKSIVFKIWNIGNQVPISSSLSYSGFPGGIIDTLTVPFSRLGISATTDSFKSFLFAQPTDTLNGAFFTGYEMNYNFISLSGDTIGLATSKDGDRITPLYTVNITTDDFGDTTRDTVITVQNATQYADNIWHDNYTDNDSILNNLAIFPIVVISGPTGVNSVSKNNLTLSGNFPNPAANSTNVQFTLQESCGVTVTLMEMTGKVISEVKKERLAAGSQIINISTQTLPAGNYIYSVRTTGGDCIASRLTVVK
ncbi:MAG: T9SS type A sorting domain-containing protein [Taibaiella sp.]|nr:T9SS type A sorting domain-containing protein [Taibaiella sp.]